VPFRNGREYLFLAAVIFLALSGAVALAYRITQPKWLRVASGAAYFCAMLVALPFLALIIGCFNGDCI
jgi:hypothetical protein